MLAVNGWQLFAHLLLLDQIEKLITAVEREKAKNPRDYHGSANAKVLATLSRLMFETIPGDPTRSEYRQGNTLGSDRRHWFRAKFGNSRFRLFFRYSTKAKIIVYAWVNDENTLRTYGAKTDAYAVFRRMLDKDNPPDEWDKLLTAARDERASNRLAAAAPKAGRPTSQTKKRGTTP